MAMVRASKTPLLLVAINEREDGHSELQVNEKALHEIREAHKPSIVIAVLGQYKTGKSSLLNRLFLEKNQFAVGHDIEPKTYGIWSHMMDHPTETDCKLVLLDTEGLNKMKSVDKNIEVTIAALTLCISSTVIWNDRFSICEGDVELLGLSCKLARKLVQQLQICSATCVPAESLVCVVENFSLRRNISQRRLTGDEYLEESLKQDNKEDPKCKRALVRQIIKESFPVRKCFTVTSPVRDNKKLRSLNELGEDELCSSYRSKLERIRRYLLTTSSPMTIGDRMMMGEDWSDLLLRCVESARSVPFRLSVASLDDDSAEGRHSQIESQYNFRHLTQHLSMNGARTMHSWHGTCLDVAPIADVSQGIFRVSRAFQNDVVCFMQIVERMQKQLRQIGYADFKTTLLHLDIFVTAVLGRQGGMISFSDKSVKMDVPPRALNEPTVLYCHRSVPLTVTPRNIVLYSHPLRVGPDDVKLLRPIQLTFRHFADIENVGQVEHLRVLTKRHQDNTFHINEDTQIDINGEWVEVRIQRPCDVVIGSVLKILEHVEGYTVTGL